MKKLFVIGAVVAAGSSQALIIDSFATGPFGVSLSSGSFVGTQNGTMATGERDVEARVLGNVFNQFLDVNIANGLEVTSNGFGVTSRVTLQYDVNGDEVGNTGAGKFVQANSAAAPILVVGSDDRLRVTFLGNDLAVNVKATILSNGVQIAQAMGVKAPGGGGVLDLLVGNSALTAADSITFEFEAEQSGDFALAEIGTVPEPATMAALALGGAALLRRRSKKS